jgi:hypothetical protein
VGRASVMGMGLPRRLASSVAARSNQSSPQDTEWPLANPSEEPFGAGAARSPHLPVCRTKDRRALRSKTGRAFGS